MPAEVQQRAKRRKQLCKTVKDNLQSFIETGLALKELHDDEHYLGTHKTFEAFCHDEFAISKSTAYRIMGSAHGGNALSQHGTYQTTRRGGVPEQHAQVVSDVKDERQIMRIVDKAAEKAGKKTLTTKHLQEAKDEVIPPAPKPKPDYRKEADALLGKLIRTLDELKLSEETFHQGPAATPLEALDRIKYMVAGEM